MQTYIVLLRGVTPTGKNKVPMAQLREALTGAGFANVRTYIQSGNALVDSPLSSKEIEQRVHALIKDKIGPDLPIMVRTGSQLKQIMDGNPFKHGHDTSHLYFVLFGKPAPPGKIKQIKQQDFGVEKAAITNTSAVLYIPGAYGRGMLSASYLEKQLGIPVTARNYNTTRRLLELAQS